MLLSMLFKNTLSLQCWVIMKIVNLMVINFCILLLHKKGVVTFYDYLPTACGVDTIVSQLPQALSEFSNTTSSSYLSALPPLSSEILSFSFLFSLAFLDGLFFPLQHFVALFPIINWVEVRFPFSSFSDKYSSAIHNRPRLLEIALKESSICKYNSFSW